MPEIVDIALKDNLEKGEEETEEHPDLHHLDITTHR